jgi:hypothetical protein
MKVEILIKGTWQHFENVTARHVAGNEYEITMTGVSGLQRLTLLDGESLRINGTPTVQVCGRRLTDGVLTAVAIV